MSVHSVKIHEDKRHAVYARDNYCCAYCKRGDGNPPPGGALSVDHIDARASGGAGQDPKNMITACRACNFAKQDKDPRAWNAYMKAQGKAAVDWTAIRRQAAKTVDLKDGAKRAADARAQRDSLTAHLVSKMLESGAAIPPKLADSALKLADKAMSQKLAEAIKNKDASAALACVTHPAVTAHLGLDKAPTSGVRPVAKPEEQGPGVRHGEGGRFMAKDAA